MHRLARLSEDERRRIIHDFLDEVFVGVDGDGAAGTVTSPKASRLRLAWQAKPQKSGW